MQLRFERLYKLIVKSEIWFGLAAEAYTKKSLEVSCIGSLLFEVQRTERGQKSHRKDFKEWSSSYGRYLRRMWVKSVPYRKTFLDLLEGIWINLRKCGNQVCMG